jgi:hypothetical protein
MAAATPVVFEARMSAFAAEALFKIQQLGDNSSN